MPTDTFFGLPEEKRQKIINAARREFAEKTFDLTSIKNIAEDAEISRGSFYQYFESKEDLLEYIIKEHQNSRKKEMNKMIKKANGDIFEMCILLYDEMLAEKEMDKEMKEFSKIFHNIMQSKEKQNLEKNTLTGEIFEESIKTEKLRINSQEDMLIIVKILLDITFKSVIDSKRELNQKNARKIILKKLEFLKNGVVKNNITKYIRRRIKC